MVLRRNAREEKHQQNRIQVENKALGMLTFFELNWSSCCWSLGRIAFSRLWSLCRRSAASRWVGSGSPRKLVHGIVPGKLHLVCQSDLRRCERLLLPGLPDGPRHRLPLAVQLLQLDLHTQADLDRLKPLLEIWQRAPGQGLESSELATSGRRFVARRRRRRLHWCRWWRRWQWRWRWRWRWWQ